MASSSIPFIFPAQAVTFSDETEWCGYGSMRQLAPVSPAIHLGSEKVFVIDHAHQDDTHPELRNVNPIYPSIAQLGCHALSNIFLDHLTMDIERLEICRAYVLPPVTNAHI